MKKPSCHDELTIRHRFDRLCQMSLKGEAVRFVYCNGHNSTSLFFRFARKEGEDEHIY